MCSFIWGGTGQYSSNFSYNIYLSNLLGPVHLLPLEDPHAGGSHAINTPVGGAVAVADGDGETAKVGTDDLDTLVVVAGDC